MKKLILMLQFFTRIPINKAINIEENSFSEGIVYLPIVGLIIGLFNGGVFFVADRCFTRTVALICALLGNIIITGALHIDGLADTCDGIYSSRSKDRMLEIMKDSRVGTNGVIAIIFILALRFGFAEGIKNMEIIKIFIAIPVIARTTLVFLMYLSRNNGNGKGLGSLFVGKISRGRGSICILLGGGISAMIVGLLGPAALFVSCLFIILYREYIIKKLGVITGDILGAAVELIELLTLVFFFCAGRV